MHLIKNISTWPPTTSANNLPHSYSSDVVVWESGQPVVNFPSYRAVLWVHHLERAKSIQISVVIHNLGCDCDTPVLACQCWSCCSFSNEERTLHVILSFMHFSCGGERNCQIKSEQEETQKQTDSGKGAPDLFISPSLRLHIGWYLLKGSLAPFDLNRN